MLACRTSLWRWITGSGRRAGSSFRGAAWWPRSISGRTSLTGRPPGDREMLGHPERNRAEPLGLSGKLDVGEPFEQDPNRDLTMEAGERGAEAEVCAGAKC